MAELTGHTGLVTCVCVVDVYGGGDGGGSGGKVQRVVSGLDDNSLRVWDVCSPGGSSCSLECRVSSVFAVDGRVGYVCGLSVIDRDAYVWDVREERPSVVACPLHTTSVCLFGTGGVVFGTRGGSVHCGRLLL